MKTFSGIALLLLVTLAGPAFSQGNTVFPQFAAGGGLSSELSFTNQGLSTVSNITVSFYDGSGNALSVVSNLGTGPSFVFTLGPGATQVIQVTSAGTGGASSVELGYVVVNYPSVDSPVSATEVYQYVAGGTVQSVVGVPQEQVRNNFSFNVEVNSSQLVNTGIALVNTSSWNQNLAGGGAETVILNLINTDGSINSTLQVPLSTGEHQSKYVDQFFPGLDNFTGTMSVSSPYGVGVTALRQVNQPFGGIATNSGPILGPFAVTATPIPVVEPNNAIGEAQPLSGSSLIAGNIVTAGDTDYFSFTGQSGEIISVICDVQTTGSSLNPVLAVTDRNGNAFALDVPNASSPNLVFYDDAFIQLVLPSSGTYYISLTDLFEGGGSDFTYRLHVILPNTQQVD